VLAGDGPLRSELEQMAKHIGIGGAVHFAGHKNSSGLVPYYAFARCFVLPSRREPWGLVVNEAMAAGLPVIVSNRCGCTEDLVEDGVNGFVFDPAKDGQLAYAMTRVQDGGADKLAAMGRSSRSIISRYSPETWANEVARIVAA
jgi:glycosyltransferase involved in cell wall biosynthesis